MSWSRFLGQPVAAQQDLPTRFHACRKWSRTERRGVGHAKRRVTTFDADACVPASALMRPARPFANVGVICEICLKLPFQRYARLSPDQPTYSRRHACARRRWWCPWAAPAHACVSAGRFFVSQPDGIREAGARTYLAHDHVARQGARDLAVLWPPMPSATKPTVRPRIGVVSVLVVLATQANVTVVTEFDHRHRRRVPPMNRCEAAVLDGPLPRPSARTSRTTPCRFRTSLRIRFGCRWRCCPCWCLAGLATSRIQEGRPAIGANSDMPSPRS